MSVTQHVRRGSVASRLARMSAAVLTTIGLLSIAAPAPPATAYRGDFGANSDVGMAATASATWLWCGATSDDYKLVRSPAYYIAGATVPDTGRGAELYCGYQDPYDVHKGWGKRHIYAAHHSDWKTLADRVGQDWESYTDDRIEGALLRPFQDYAVDGKIKYRSNFHTGSGETRKNYCSMIVMTQQSGRIITAFFSRGVCP